MKSRCRVISISAADCHFQEPEGQFSRRHCFAGQRPIFKFPYFLFLFLNSLTASSSVLYLRTKSRQAQRNTRWFLVGCSIAYFPVPMYLEGGEAVPCNSPACCQPRSAGVGASLGPSNRHGSCFFTNTLRPVPLATFFLLSLLPPLSWHCLHPTSR